MKDDGAAPGQASPSKVATATAGHLVDLADGWTLWRTVCLRGAGFPVAILEALEAGDALAAIDRQIDGEARFEDARRRAVDYCSGVLAATAGEDRKRWRRVLKRLSKGHVPDCPPAAPAAGPIFTALAQARREAEEARRDAAAAFQAELPRLSAAIRDIGLDARFREALTWQNRGALRDGVDVLLRTPPTVRNQRVRRHEQLIVSYIQRYCAKNDSIGFFGPIGWAEYVDDGPAMSMRPGPDLVAAREVHFEHRTIEALARVLAEDPRLRPWLAPRLDPRVRLDGTALVAVSGKRLRLTAAGAQLLAACDGEALATEIADRFVADPDTPFTAKADVYATLDRAAQEGALIWTLDVPIAPHPERALRRKLDRIGDEDLRRRLTAPLDAIEADRAEVAAARGDDAVLGKSIARLENRFTRLTGQRPTQFEGTVYGGRMLVYEDCRRDIHMSLGPEFVERLAPPIMPICLSARWFTYTVAKRFLEHIDELYGELEQASGGRPVDFAALWNRVFSSGDIVNPKLQAVVDELAARWGRILAPGTAVRRLAFAADTLRRRVAAAFAAPHPGWPAARYQSPDIMVAADSVEAIRRGRYRVVLGELHAGECQIFQTPLFLMHPRPEDLIAAGEIDIPIPRILPINHRSYQRGQRTAPYAQAAWDLHLGCHESPSWRPPDQVLPLSDLVVERTPDGLFVRTRDGAKRFHIIQFFERQARFWTVPRFGLRAAAPHAPRITVDDLVICRETWRFPCSEVAFARERHEADRFTGARRWARANDLPRRVFVRFPQEQKPVYVDLASPPSVELMAKLTRLGAETGEDAAITVSEMMPTPEQAWLMDSQGNRYTSELRIVAVDPEPWRPS